MSFPTLSFAALAAAVLSPFSFAQTQTQTQTQAQSPAQTQAAALSIPGPPTYLGVYHVETGTWSDGPGPAGVGSSGSPAASSPAAALGLQEIIYDNTANPTAYFDPTTIAGFDRTAWVHSYGGVPGTSNPTPFPVSPTRDQYRVNRLEVGYVDLTGGTNGSMAVRLNSGLGVCMPSFSANGYVTVSGLPSGGAFTFTFDLGEFFICIESDGSPEAPLFDGVQSLDTLGIAVRYAPSQPGPAGVLLAGDPANTESNWTPGSVPTEGRNTYYGGPSLCGTGSTGYLAEDRLMVFQFSSPGSPSPTCVSLGGYAPGLNCGAPQAIPFASAYCRLYASPGLCELPRTQCTGAGLGYIYCNSNPNSTGVNATLRLCGHPMVEKNDMLLEASNVPRDSFGFFLASQTPGFGANPAGSAGNICVGGNIGRLVAPGQIQQAGPSGLISLDTLLGQWSLQAIPTAVGPFMDHGDFSAIHFQLWYRDSAAGQPTSNFSDALQFITR